MGLAEEQEVWRDDFTARLQPERTVVTRCVDGQYHPRSRLGFTAHKSLNGHLPNLYLCTFVLSHAHDCLNLSHAPSRTVISLNCLPTLVLLVIPLAACSSCFALPFCLIYSVCFPMHALTKLITHTTHAFCTHLINPFQPFSSVHRTRVRGSTGRVRLYLLFFTRRQILGRRIRMADAVTTEYVCVSCFCNACLLV